MTPTDNQQSCEYPEYYSNEPSMLQGHLDWVENNASKHDSNFRFIVVNGSVVNRNGVTFGRTLAHLLRVRFKCMPAHTFATPCTPAICEALTIPTRSEGDTVAYAADVAQAVARSEQPARRVRKDARLIRG